MTIVRGAGVPTRSLPRILAGLAVGGAALGVATGVVAALEAPPVSIDDASPVFLVTVVIVGALYGTWPAMAAAVAAFFLYNLLFIEPLYTLSVEDPGEWLDLVLFLFVGVAVGRLSALPGDRAREESRRAGESQALFAISRILATTDLRAAASPIVERLSAETGLRRVWIALERPGPEAILADSDRGQPHPAAPTVWTLARTPGDSPAEWVRVHQPRADRELRPASDPKLDLFRVRIETGGVVLGSVYATHPRARGRPGRETARLLALAADQIALALRREQLAREATEVEIARRSDALKSALLESVSHDLRTPLASIRASAGSLADPAVGWTDAERRAAGRAIESQVERLNRLVTNLLDLSRIEGGALRPEPEVFELPELVEPLITRLGPALGGRAVQLDIASDLPPVRVDAVLFEQALTNVLENAIRHAGPAAPIRLGARRDGPERIELVVEDGGPGVPPEALPHLFDRFYRIQPRRDGARPGLGIGLSVVRGLIEAMGGQARAEASQLGGLAIRLELPAAPEPPPEQEAP